MTAYVNPVLNADWSDPDAVRVGDAYYLTASTFNRVPGLPILRSTDLVHWEPIGHALPRLVPEGHYDLPRHGGGVWAPALRHHDGRFVIVYPDPDHGLFVVTATDPAGPWTEPRLLHAGRGLIDPCPFWDDDGRAYLAHGWATTRAGVNNLLTLHPLAPDASRLLGPGRTVVDGAELPGFTVLEGPKLHKRDGWYWIFAPAGGVPDGWQSVFRSRSIWGPYEERTVLAQGSSPVNGPHQGTWVTAPDGGDWYLHFQDRGAFGRVVHLQPMSWGDDGWPRIGAPAEDGGAGEPVASFDGPAGTGAPPGAMPTSDDWAGGIGPQWYWQANPGPDWAAARDGMLELAARPGDPADLRELPNVLAQRLPGTPSVARVSLSLRDAVPGTRAGLVVLGRRYCWLGLQARPDGDLAVVAATGADRRREQLLSMAPARLGPDTVVDLRATVDATAEVRLSWRAGGGEWAGIATPFQATAGFWTGAHLGIFATSPHGGGAPPPAARFGPFRLDPA